MSDYQSKFYKIIGSMLKDIRRDAGFTLEQAGEKIGVIAKTIQRYETGERKISINMLMELTSLYGVDYTSFIGTAKKRLAQEDISKSEDLPLDACMDSQDDISKGHYLNREAMEIAQQVYERPELRMLFSASKNVSAEDLQAVIAIVDRMKKRDE